MNAMGLNGAVPEEQNRMILLKSCRKNFLNALRHFSLKISVFQLSQFLFVRMFGTPRKQIACLDCECRAADRVFPAFLNP